MWQKNMLWLWTHDGYIHNSLQPKFISQSQINISFKCLKSLAFCRNNGYLMENHGLGTHIDKFNWKYPTVNLDLRYNVKKTFKKILPMKN